MNAQIAGVETERALNFIIGVRTDETEVAVADAVARLAGWVDAQKIPAAVDGTARGSSARAEGPNPSSGGGSITQAQLDALAQCESSGVNGWRTGLFGIESGNEGSKSYEEQVADVNRIYQTSGASAWGILCRGILGG